MKLCSRCLSEKSPGEFPKCSNRPDGLNAWCKECHRSYTAARKDRVNALARNSAKIHRRLHPERLRAKEKRYYQRHKKQRVAYQHARYHQSVDLCLAHYGKNGCECCGECRKQFLTIDHVHNNGADHRRILNGENLCSWLRRKGFPVGYRVLCYNCNCGRYRNGGICPHQEKLEAVA